MNSSWMTGLNTFGAVWAENMVRACWQGGLLLLLIGTLYRFLPRLPAALQRLLWWMACLRLLLGLVVAPVTLALLPPTPRPALHTSLPMTSSLPSKQSSGAAQSPPDHASAPDVAAAPV